jgi:hypothetical protein
VESYVQTYVSHICIFLYILENLCFFSLHIREPFFVYDFATGAYKIPSEWRKILIIFITWTFVTHHSQRGTKKKLKIWRGQVPSPERVSKGFLINDYTRGHKEMSSILLTKCGGGGGIEGSPANEYSCAHGAQINFGDLTTCFTYVKPMHPILSESSYLTKC